MNNRGLSIALAAIFTCGLAVTGCGGSSSSNSSSGDGASLKASDLNPKPRSALKTGGTIKWAIDEFPTQYNYNQLDGTSDAASQIIYAVMPRPFRADPKANITPNTNFVLSAKVTATSPHQVVTYKLNPKARWSDGKPITVADWIAEWKVQRGKDPKYDVSSTTGYERISSVKQGADPYEVITTYSKPFGEWQALFDPLYPAETNSSPAHFDKDYFGKLPVTGGPFNVSKIDKSAKTITIVRNPKWWGDKPALDAIIYRSLPDDTFAAAFANGEIDYGDLGPDPSQYKRAKGVSGGAVREAGGPDFRHFTINGTGPILKDVNVRKAIAMGIDREVLAKADLTGLNWPARTMGNHFLVNTQDGYADNSGDVGKFDPEAAKKLLDDAGWKLNGTYRTKGGKQLKLRFVIPAQVSTSRQEGELSQKMLKDIGVNLDVQTVPSDPFFDKYVTPGNFDITPFSWIGTPFPISSGQSIYINPTKDSKGELQIQQNYARVGSKQINSLMTQAQQEVDRGKAADLTNQADKLVWAEVHSLTLYQRPQITAVKATLANIGAFGLAYKNYELMGYVK
jgi:peptide/nickel transport system substrate-binding protein